MRLLRRQVSCEAGRWHRRGFSGRTTVGRAEGRRVLCVLWRPVYSFALMAPPRQDDAVLLDAMCDLATVINP
jgi:hypothetical protein